MNIFDDLNSFSYFHDVIAMIIYIFGQGNINKLVLRAHDLLIVKGLLSCRLYDFLPTDHSPAGAFEGSCPSF